jgi:hypothetical protein
LPAREPQFGRLANQLGAQKLLELDGLNGPAQTAILALHFDGVANDD